MQFAIVDIETTGSRPKANGMTEIAVIVTDGNKILDRFQTLLKPSEPIAPYVRQLTGINEEMLEDAPQFHEVAEELSALFHNRIFVAHNVNFDYSFLRAEFDGVGIQWQTSRLCTIRLARHFIPGLKRYSLGALCQTLDIPNEAAHRAMGDCHATYLIFKQIYESAGQEKLESFFKLHNKVLNLPPSISREAADSIPEKPGVYYFKDSRGNILYIGKAINLAKRVKGHFTPGNLSGRKQSFMREVAEIDFQLTGNELIACVLEDSEIRKHRPPHNRAQRELVKLFGIIPFRDGRNVQKLTMEQLKLGQSADIVFPAKTQAIAWLNKFAARHQIPPRQVGLPSLWSLTSDDLPEAENLHELFLADANQRERFRFMGQGRTQDEKALLEWCPGSSLRFGFFCAEESYSAPDEILESGISVKFSATIESILANATLNPAKWGVKLIEMKEGRLPDLQ
jgi:DNA polymerase III subunit epsilon